MLGSLRRYDVCLRIYQTGDGSYALSTLLRRWSIRHFPPVGKNHQTSRLDSSFYPFEKLNGCFLTSCCSAFHFEAADQDQIGSLEITDHSIRKELRLARLSSFHYLHSQTANNEGVRVIFSNFGENVRLYIAGQDFGSHAFCSIECGDSYFAAGNSLCGINAGSTKNFGAVRADRSFVREIAIGWVITWTSQVADIDLCTSLLEEIGAELRFERLAIMTRRLTSCPLFRALPNLLLSRFLRLVFLIALVERRIFESRTVFSEQLGDWFVRRVRGRGLVRGDRFRRFSDDRLGARGDLFRDGKRLTVGWILWRNRDLACTILIYARSDADLVVLSMVSLHLVQTALFAEHLIRTRGLEYRSDLQCLVLLCILRLGGKLCLNLLRFG